MENKGRSISFLSMFGRKSFEGEKDFYVVQAAFNIFSEVLSLLANYFEDLYIYPILIAIQLYLVEKTLLLAGDQQLMDGSHVKF